MCSPNQKSDSIPERRSSGRLLLVLGLLFLGVCSTAQPAIANAYAYSRQTVTALNVSNGNAQNERTASFSSALFQGFGLAQDLDDLDALEAESGPGPFPPQNYFAPWGRQGEYSRGDSLIENTNITSIRGHNVAEDYSTSSAFAASSAYDTFDFTLQVTNPRMPIILSMTDAPGMMVSTTRNGETSTANIEFSIALYDANTGGLVFRWRPNGTQRDFTLNQGSVSNVIDPYSLNTGISCSIAGCSDTYAQNPDDFSISYRNPMVNTYDVTISWEETAGVDIRNIPTPEPSSLLLLSSGMFAAAGLVKRRSAAFTRGRSGA